MINKNPFDIFSLLNLEQLNSLKKMENTCSNIQCALFSDYFWKMANQKSIDLLFKKNNFTKKNIITIVSASQTGNAKSLSVRLDKYLTHHNKKTNLINASEYKFKKIHNENVLILIISTQDDGKPPEEALSLYKYIMSKKAPKLDNLYYSVFALGDISYNLFCQSGKDFDKRLKELGAKSLIDRLDADIEYEDDYKKWSQKLLEKINKNNMILHSSSLSEEDNENNFITSSITYTKIKPATAYVLVNQKITGRNSIKDVHHIEIDISNLKINYIPGDALGIWYKNDINLVQKILNIFSINSLDTIELNSNVITIFHALKNHFELINNTKNTVKSYANFTNNKFLKKIASNSEKLQNYSINTPLINMFYEYPSDCSAEQLISFLRQLKPRLYSISSAQEKVNNEIHITVGVVKKILSGHIHLGGSSSYLSQYLNVDDKIKIFIEANNNFRLPKNKDTSIIMIGSGTGVAPFRAFMQQRDHDGSTGKNWIFFGNVNFSEDFLYQTDWQQYMKKGLLNKMNLSWSQDQKYKIYVQDKIRENGKEIWSWIEEGAHIYVCGNASKMAKDVEKALLDVISKNSGMNYEDSDEFLNTLRVNKRYQRDIY